MTNPATKIEQETFPTGAAERGVIVERAKGILRERRQGRAPSTWASAPRVAWTRRD